MWLANTTAPNIFQKLDLLVRMPFCWEWPSLRDDVCFRLRRSYVLLNYLHLADNAAIVVIFFMSITYVVPYVYNNVHLCIVNLHFLPTDSFSDQISGMVTNFRGKTWKYYYGHVHAQTGVLTLCFLSLCSQMDGYRTWLERDSLPAVRLLLWFLKTLCFI